MVETVVKERPTTITFLVLPGWNASSRDQSLKIGDDLREVRILKTVAAPNLNCFFPITAAQMNVKKVMLRVD